MLHIGTIPNRWIAGAVSASLLTALPICVAATHLIVPEAQVGKPARPALPPGYQWELSFSDEFEGDRLNLAKWTNAFASRSHRNPSISKRLLRANGERQVYFDAHYLDLGVDPFRVKGGVLSIIAQRLSAQDREAVMQDVARQPASFRADPVKYKVAQSVAYSSGLISSRDHFAQKYGYFEMRARWTGGKGLWPAFWLLPDRGNWPPEIDILEAHGDKERSIYQSLHSKFPPKAVTKAVSIPNSGTTDQFHRYGVHWLPDRIDYYIDGIKTASLATTADMTGKMYVLVNLAVGGHWPGLPDGQTQFPAILDVDYVKVWQASQDVDARPSE